MLSSSDLHQMIDKGKFDEVRRGLDTNYNIDFLDRFVIVNRIRLFESRFDEVLDNCFQHWGVRDDQISHEGKLLILIIWAEAALEKGLFNEVERLLDQIMGLFPNDPQEKINNKIMIRWFGQLKIIQAVNHIRKSEYEEAQSNLKFYIKVIDLKTCPLIHARLLIQLSNCYTDTAKLDNAKKLIIKSLEVRNKLGNHGEIANSLNALGINYGKRGKLGECLPYFEMAGVEAAKGNNLVELIQSLRNIAFVYFKKGNFAIALEHIDQAFDLITEINNYNELTAILIVRGNIKARLGNLTEAENDFSNALKYSNAIGFKKYISSILNNLGAMNLQKCNFDDSLVYFEEGIRIKEEYNDPDVGSLLFNIGTIYKQKGDFYFAIEYYTKTINVINATTKNTQLLAKTINNLGKIYSIMGNLQLSESYFRQALDTWKEINNERETSKVLINLANVRKIQGDYRQALDYYRQCLKIRYNLNDILLFSEILYHLIELSIEMGNENVNEYQKQLVTLSTNTDNKIVSQRAKLSSVMVLQESNRIENKVRSKEIMEELINEEFTSYEINNYILLSMAKYLFQEYQLFRDDEILDELDPLIERIYKISRRQENYSLLLDLFLLQTELAIFQNRLSEAKFIIDHAKSIAEFRGLHRYTEKLTYEEVSLSFAESKQQIVEPTEAENFELQSIIHDIKNLLTASVNIAELIEMEPNVTDAIRVFASSIKFSNMEINELLYQLRTIDNISLGTQETTLKNTNISGEFKERCKIYESRGKEKSIEFNFSVKHPIWGDVDNSLLSRIFDNLIFNAIRFAPEESTIGVVLTQDDDEYLRFSVSNDGPPIPKEKQEGIFNRISRKEGNGNDWGIGLAFCKHALDLMGGTINLISPKFESKRGAIFHVSIPLK